MSRNAKRKAHAPSTLTLPNKVTELVEYNQLCIKWLRTHMNYSATNKAIETAHVPDRIINSPNADILIHRCQGFHTIPHHSKIRIACTFCSSSDTVLHVHKNIYSQQPWQPMCKKCESK